MKNTVCFFTFVIFYDDIGEFFYQGEVERKKLSIFKMENIQFFLFGQVDQLSGCMFCGSVDLNGLGLGWGRGTNP